MILVDTGPLVALFDNKDAAHDRCARVLKGLREPLKTTFLYTNAKDLRYRSDRSATNSA